MFDYDWPLVGKSPEGLRGRIARRAFVSELCANDSVREAIDNWNEVHGLAATTRRYQSAADCFAQHFGFADSRSIRAAIPPDTKRRFRQASNFEEKCRILRDWTGQGGDLRKAERLLENVENAIVSQEEALKLPESCFSEASEEVKLLFGAVAGVLGDKHKIPTWLKRRLVNQLELGWLELGAEFNEPTIDPPAPIVRVITRPGAKVSELRRELQRALRRVERTSSERNSNQRLPRETQQAAIVRNVRWFYRANVDRTVSHDKLAREYCEAMRQRGVAKHAAGAHWHNDRRLVLHGIAEAKRLIRL